MTQRRIIFSIAALAVVIALAVVLWPRSDVPAVEDRAQQIAAAVNAADREQLSELLNYDIAADTLLQDAAGTTVTFEPGGVQDKGDGDYTITLARASGDPLVIHLSYRGGVWGQAAVP